MLVVGGGVDNKIFNSHTTKKQGNSLDMNNEIIRGILLNSVHLMVCPDTSFIQRTHTHTIYYC
jgi:hypothetical protein